jgi:hypothetical protein
MSKTPKPNAAQFMTEHHWKTGNQVIVTYFLSKYTRSDERVLSEKIIRQDFHQKMADVVHG